MDEMETEAQDLGRNKHSASAQGAVGRATKGDNMRSDEH
jgi:hypothetical protein